MDSATHVKCSCPNCQRKFSLASRYAGRKARCPGCQSVFTIPPIDDIAGNSVSSTPAASNAPEPSGDVSIPSPTTARHHVSFFRRLRGFWASFLKQAKHELSATSADIDRRAEQIRYRVQPNTGSPSEVVQTELAPSQEPTAIADSGNTPSSDPTVDKRQRTILIVSFACAGFVALCLIIGAIVFAATRDDTPLVHRTIQGAAREGDLADVKRHLRRGAAVNGKDDKGMTPLHHAACILVMGSSKRERDMVEVVEYLIAQNAEVDARDDEGVTPLHLAALKGHKEVAEILIAHGADVNAEDNEGNTPLHMAATIDWSGDKDTLVVMLACLIDKGAKVNARDSGGWTPLHTAVFWGEESGVEYLIAQGADVNARDNTGDTPLYLATLGEHREVIRILKRHGAME